MLIKQLFITKVSLNEGHACDAGLGSTKNVNFIILVFLPTKEQDVEISIFNLLLKNISNHVYKNTFNID